MVRRSLSMIMFQLILCSSIFRKVPCEVITSSVDKSIYTVERYNNLTVIYLQDKQYTKSGIGLSFNVGFTKDPENIQGLCHFVKHVLLREESSSFIRKLNSRVINRLLSSKRADSFETFVLERGGDIDGKITMDNTTYYFEIETKYLKEAVGKACFTKPLMSISEELVNTVINEIDEEFLMNRSNPLFNIHSVLIEMVKKEGELKNTLGCGNREILEGISKKELIRSALNIIQNEYIRAKKTLVLSSNQELEDMRNIAKLFIGWTSYSVDNIAEILHKNKDTEMLHKNKDIRNITDELIENNFLSKIIYHNQFSYHKTVRIITMVPIPVRYIRVNPLRYIKEIFEREQLSQELPSEPKFNFMKYGNQILVEIELEFYNNETIKVFISAVYEFMSSFRADKTRYESIKKWREILFKAKELEMLKEKVFTIAENSMKYPLEYITSGEEIFIEYDADVINKYISSIGDLSKWIVFVEGFVFRPSDVVVTDKPYIIGKSLVELINSDSSTED